jgi:fumarate hydratase class II
MFQDRIVADRRPASQRYPGASREEARRMRIERDSLGEVEVPDDALWGAQTQRALQNFELGGLRMPRAFLRALGLVKRAAAEVNAELGALEPELARALATAAQEVADGLHDAHFPVDVYQTGSGTSTNMNANEVIARLASLRLGRDVHANDHANRSQSSNDVIPTAIHVAAVLELETALLPALGALRAEIEAKAATLAGVVKTGRTHLMDALPLRMDQELGAWAQQLAWDRQRLEAVLPRLLELAQGGTAIGSGANAPRGFAARFAARLGELSGRPFRASPNPFASIASQDSALELSGALRVTAVTLLKIANDLRWMNSGPIAGLAEIELPALQPGSSIMPGKVNPVIPEAVAQACTRVLGNDAALAIAGQAASFQLHTMLPLVAFALLESIALLARSSRALGEKAIRGMRVDAARLARDLGRNPMLATALAPRIGYESAARIARRAATEGRSVREIALEATDLSADELDRLLDPRALTGS